MLGFKDALYELIGRRVKSLRKQRELSQEDLSDFLELSRSSISNIESGRHQTPLSTLYELSHLFKIDIHDLIPSYDEVSNLLNSEIKDYTEILEAQDLNNRQRKKIENLLKNIGKNAE